MFRPVFGTETEYGVSPTSKVQVEDIVTWLFKAASHGGVPGVQRDETNIWVVNGARLYRDIGSHPEYATPECTEPREIACHEWAGPIMLNKAYRSRPATSERPVVRILKNNTDHLASTSYGNHINVLMPLRQSFGDDLEDFVGAMGAMLATLPLVVGAGLVIPPGPQCRTRLAGRNFRYRISARSHFFAKLIGTASTSTQERPMFLARDEHHVPRPGGGSHPYWRLQPIFFDSNILPSVIELKVGLVVLAVLMWAEGSVTPISLANPVAAFRQLSSDWKIPLSVVAGRRLTAVQVGLHYLAQAEAFVKRRQLAMFEPILAEWRFQLQAFSRSTGVPEALFLRNDWVTKWLMIKRRTERTGCHDYYIAENLHLHYHTFELGDHFADSVPVRLAERASGSAFLEAARRASLRPPAAARGVVRSAFVNLVGSSSPHRAEAAIVGPLAVDWSRLQLGQHHINIGDPFTTDVRPVSELGQLLAAGRQLPAA